MQTLGEFEYSQGDILGHGAFALVFKGRRKKDRLQVAIKQISLKSVSGKLSSIRQKEIAILKDLKNPYIVQLYDYLVASSDIFLVLEYCNGGDMGDYLAEKKSLSESSIRHLIRHTAMALEALFKLNIIHRDIKPQNLLLSYPLIPPITSASSSSSHHGTPSIKRPFTDAAIKLADFGFARHLSGADMAATLCGSPLYMAPEILMGQRYDRSVDLWSMGTIAYQCLTSSAPFLASNPHALRKRYERESLVPKIPAGTSHTLSDLLVKLLKKNPAKRLTHYDFFRHNFLKDPSSFSSDPLFSHHAKSSPVPIKRRSNPPSSAYSMSPSPKHSISPHRSSSVDVSNFSPSSFSGPPLSHRVGSQASLPYYSVQSPNTDINTDITDQGFILVEFPGGPGSRRCSVSSSGGHSSSGRNSSLGNTHCNHTPSCVSGSFSLLRYSSLTTPFYQATPRQTQQQQQQQHPQQQQQQQQQQVLKANGTTVKLSPTQGTNSQCNSGYVSNRPSPSSSIPFGKLVKHSGSSPLTNTSNFSSNSSCSMEACSQASPFSTPPSSLPSSATPLTHHGTPGIKGIIPRHNSGTKLSALTEESRQNLSHRLKKDDENYFSEKNSSGSFGIITKSCLLDFEENTENISATEEDHFPLSLDMSITELEDEDGESYKSIPALLQPGQLTTAYQSVGGSIVERPTSTYHHSDNTSDAVCCASRQSHLLHRPLRVPTPSESPPSMVGKGTPSKPKAIGTRRTTSFSCGQNPARNQDSTAIQTKASSKGDEIGGPHPVTPMLRSSSSEEDEIVTMKVPFIFSGSCSSKASCRARLALNKRKHQSGDMCSKERNFARGHVDSQDVDGSSGADDKYGDVKLGSLCWTEMRDMLVLVEEMQAMAKARQGPILLMSTSTSLSDSGVAGRHQRCSEQLVLYAKAISLLDSLSTRYGLELALTGHEEPPEEMAAMVDRVADLHKCCLEKAKQVKMELHSVEVNGHSLEIRLSAERLLFLEALDMCKAALLDEKPGNEKECIKHYRRAKLILQHLLSEAHTPHDKQILLKYLQSAQTRLSHILTP